MSIRRLWVLVKYLPADAAAWRVASVGPRDSQIQKVSVADFAARYRAMKK